MNTRFAAVLSVALAALALDVSGAEVVSLEWSADNTFSREMSVPAGKFVEACGKLPAKTQVEWSFEAGGPLDFNVHFHEGKKVHFPARQDQVARSRGTLDAKVEQDYCWMWTNKGAAEASLRFRLARR